MTIELTDKQQAVLNLIRDWIACQGGSPTRAEIARAMGFRSVNAAEEHCRALVIKGAITIIRGQARGIRIPPPQTPPTPATENGA